MAFLAPIIPFLGATAATTAGTAAATAGSVGAAAIGTAGAAAATGFSLTSMLTTGLGILGSGISAISAIKQGQTQGDLLEANAKQLRSEGDMIVEQGKGDQLKLSRQRRQVIGKQVAAIGASGTDYSGSSLDVISETAKNFEEDIQQLGYQGDATARTRYNTADIYNWEAGNRRRSGWWGGLGNLATGVGKLALLRN